MAEKVKIARQGMTWRHIAIVVTMCLSIFTAVGIIFTAAGLCYRPVAQHFGVPVSQVSLYITFVYLGQMAGGVPGGLLFDKFNAKTVCCVAAILVVVPYIGFAFYPAIWCYWVAGFIIGLGLAVVEFTMTAGILSRWFHTNYGTVTGIVFAFTGVGGVVWNLIGQIVLGPQLAGWHELYIIFSICMLVGTLPFIAIFVKRTPEECGTLPFGMPIDKEAMENELAAEEAIAKGEAEEGFKAKEVLKFPFFWTLLLGLLAIWSYEEADRRGALWAGIIAMIVALRLGDMLQVDYESPGVGCVLFMYFAGKTSHKGLQLVLCGLGIAWTGAFSLLFGGNLLQLCALLALIPIGLYNGQKGRQGPRFLWYGLYPLHLLLLWLLQIWL